MAENTTQLRKRYYQNLEERSLEPDDPFYVYLYDQNTDPILLIKESIDFTAPTQGSVHLLSGYRGAGKSTELRRLRSQLQEDGYLVVLIDIEEYLDLHSPVDITNFLLALCGALGEALEDDTLLGQNPSKETIWGRLTNFLQTEVNISELSLSEPATNLGLKADLKGNPTVRQRIQKQLASHLPALGAEARKLASEALLALQKRHGEDAQLVVLVDSIEHARGTLATDAEVHTSLENLFTQHDDKIKFPSIHMVYTVPPWLRIRHPGVGGYYKGLYTLPEHKVFFYDQEAQRPYEPGLLRLRELVSKRMDIDRFFAQEASLDRLLRISGGHLRDLLRLLRAAVLQARTLPAEDEEIDLAISRVRNEFLIIANQDARWLAGIAQTHKVDLDNQGALGDLSRFFDTHLVLCYLNGDEWFDVHPLVRDHILKQVEALNQRAQTP